MLCALDISIGQSQGNQFSKRLDILFHFTRPQQCCVVHKSRILNGEAPIPPIDLFATFPLDVTGVVYRHAGKRE